MKKLLKGVSLALTLTLLVSLFAGCGEKEVDKKVDEGEATSKKIVIGLSLPTQAEERWVRDKERMVEEAKKLGVELKVQVANNDVAQQDSQARNLIAQGVDVLIIAPQDAAAAATVVDVAAEEGIPVISYDRLIMGTKNLEYYLSFDNVKVGELQGEYITKLVPKGKYIIMAGAPTDNNATLFKQGAMKFIQPLIDKGDIEVIVDQPVEDWKPVNALKIVENALTKSNNDVQAILAPNDGTAGGAVQALTAQKLQGLVPITGQDSEVAAAQRIVEGTQSMTIFKDTRELGTAAIQAAVKLANGEKVETEKTVNNNSEDVPSILLAPTVVDKENIDKVLIDSGYMKKEDVYNK